MRRNVLLPERAQVDAAERDAPFLRVEEPQEQVRHGGLPGAARADEGDALAGLEPQVESFEGRRHHARVPRGDSLERHDDGRSGRGRRPLGIAHGRLVRRQLEDTPPGGERSRQLARGGWQRRDGLERGECEQRERRDEHTVERPRHRGRPRRARARRRSSARPRRSMQRPQCRRRARPARRGG